ncbi:MAG: NAD(P)(+) transhydrogenase (Re/Si-specific) subunit beta [Vicinamibacteria bacterium]|nr:NAD(P)(+) transhydrogenase (Re/Si-specific) subunit beta [Vicinamibacteria bacterium]
MTQGVVNLGYLIGAVCFILAFKMMSSPRTAARGNTISSFGMLLAIVITVLNTRSLNVSMVAAAILIGAAIGAWLAKSTPMTGMPQMVALLNGFGGGASLFVAGGSLHAGDAPGLQALIATGLSGIVGSVTFWGSLVAYGKLEEWKFLNGLRLSAHKTAVFSLLSLSVLAMIPMIVLPQAEQWFWISAGIASLLGVLLVVAIGGADMPVVICLLNSYSGIAAAATGFVLNNSMLIIAGSLVGASGLILTQIMCKAMNRSMANVLLGAMDASTAAKADDVYGGKVKSASAEEIAMLLAEAQSVVIVPGYGLAVSQGQHALKDLVTKMAARGARVTYAIHPVAGRMPGHMNVLLAEADIPYDQVKEMDEINPEFKETDVAIVIGANDIVNPIAREPKGNPIAGMPILDVDQARTVIVLKRSLSPGFAGIPNPLFALPNTLMFYADGKKGLSDLAAALKEV